MKLIPKSWEQLNLYPLRCQAKSGGIKNHKQGGIRTHGMGICVHTISNRKQRAHMNIMTALHKSHYSRIFLYFIAIRIAECILVRCNQIKTF